MAEIFFRKKMAQPVGALMGTMLQPALKARGFASLEVIARWDELAGPNFAGRTRALQLKWPPRGAKTDPEALNAGATLIVAVSSAAALELQHMAPQIIERVNATLGWRCVTKLSLRQQPITRKGPPIPRETPLTLPEIQRLEDVVGKVEDENLRHALLRLGKGVFQRKKQG